MFKNTHLGSRNQDEDRSSFRLVPFILVIVITTSIIWILLPAPGDGPVPPKPISSAELRDLLEPFIVTEASAPRSLGEQQLGLARFGRKLFFDAKFSANGQISCATCHQPDRSFTDGLSFSQGIGRTFRSAPTIINSVAGSWFFWDGRADSLAAQALQPIETPREHGISRAFVATIIRRHYLRDYEALFGAWPAVLIPEFTENAMPQPKRREMAISISAYALKTIGNFDVLEGMLDRAEEEGIAPAEELARRSGVTLPINPEWVKAWESLPVDTQSEINRVFSNFGRAVEAFERGLTATNSPFDQFAAKVVAGAAVQDAYSPEFSSEELAGFRLFVGKGHCTNCHIGPMFSDQQFHNTGFKGHAGADEAAVDLGRAQGVIDVMDNEFNCLGHYLKPLPQEALEPSESCLELPYLAVNNIEFVGAFKTPTLRNVASTAPYGHDGRFSDLREILGHYNRLGQKPQVGHQEDTLRPLLLRTMEIDQLEKFLRSLTSPVHDLSTGLAIDQRP